MNKARKLIAASATTLMITSMVALILAGSAAATTGLNPSSNVEPDVIADDEGTDFKITVAINELSSNGSPTSETNSMRVFLPDAGQANILSASVDSYSSTTGSITGASVSDSSLPDINVDIVQDDTVGDAENVVVELSVEYLPPAGDNVFDVTASVDDVDGASIENNIVGDFQVLAEGPVLRERTTTGYDHYTTIQRAIDEASSGQTIKVMNSYDSAGEKYYDDTGNSGFPIVVDEGVTIEDYSPNNSVKPEINAAGSASKAVSVTAKNVTIDGLKIVGAPNINVIDVGSGLGTFVLGNSTVRVKDSDDNPMTLGLYSESDVLVENNLFTGGGQTWTKAIEIKDDQNVGFRVTLDNNIYKNLHVGVHTKNVKKATIGDSTFENIRAEGVIGATSDGSNISGTQQDITSFLVENNDFTDLGQGVYFLNRDKSATSISADVNYNNFDNADAGYTSWDGTVIGGAALATDVYPDSSSWDGSGTLQDDAVDAEHNYWNDAGGPLADANDDGTLGDNVDYGGSDIDVAPWLDAPYPGGSEQKVAWFEADWYAEGENLTVKAYDGPVANEGEDLDVTVYSQETEDTATVTLVETSKTGVFAFENLNTVENSAKSGGDNLYVKPNDTIVIQQDTTTSQTIIGSAGTDSYWTYGDPVDTAYYDSIIPDPYSLADDGDGPRKTY